VQGLSKLKGHTIRFWIAANDKVACESEHMLKVIAGNALSAYMDARSGSGEYKILEV
jgi:hypothetical protein